MNSLCVVRILKLFKCSRVNILRFTMLNLILILIIMPFITSNDPPIEVSSPTITRTATTETVCNDVTEIEEICYTDYCVDYDTYENGTVYCVDMRDNYCRENSITRQSCSKSLYSGAMFAKNSSGNYAPFRSVVKLNQHSTETDKIVLEGLNSTTNLTFKAYNPGGQPMPIQSVVGFNVVINESRANYKWGYNLNLPNVNFVARVKIESDGELTYDNNYVYVDGLKISFDDVLEYNYSYTLNDDGGIYYEITKDYNGHGIKNNDMIWIDPTITLNSSNKDGWIYKEGVGWDNIHDGTTGNSASNTSVNGQIEARNDVAIISISRAFFYFDTSPLSNNIINNVSLNLYGGNLNESGIMVQNGTQSDALTTADFDSCQPTPQTGGGEYGHNNTVWKNEQWNKIEFNSLGISGINKEGTTKLCVREYYYDYLDVDPTPSWLRTNFRMFENGSFIPYLNITYTLLTNITITDCTTLNSENGIYYLTQDITDSSTSNCMDITANNVTLDCQGHTIDGGGNADNGVRNSGYDSFTIKNCTLTDWDTTSITLISVENNTLSNINISSQEPDTGIDIRTSSNGIIVKNVSVRDARYGILFSSSDYLTLSDVNLTNSSYTDLSLSLTTPCSHSFNNVMGTNNKPIVFYNSSVSINNWNNNISELILCGADNSVINNLTFNSSNNNIMYIINSDNVNVTNSKFTNLYRAISLTNSNYNIFNNIYIHDTFNTINTNNVGITISSTSDYNTFSNINISYSHQGISLGGDFNNITNVTIFNCTRGISEIGGGDNIITQSNFYNNSIGFYYTGTNDLIYNNIFNQTINVEFSYEQYNSWNTSLQTGTNIFNTNNPNIGGNYWTNSSSDGYSDTCTDSDYDGFCDTAYNVSSSLASVGGTGDNVDYLPLSTEYDTAPTVPNVTYPVNNTNYTDIPYINYSSTDADGDPITYYIYINGELNITTTTNITDWNASDGNYYIEVSAYGSKRFSANSSRINFTLDSTSPITTPTMTSPAGGASYTNDTWTKNNIKVTLSAVDLGIGYDNLKFPVYCTDTVNTCIPNTFISSGATITTEGTSYIRYYSNDTLNNSETVDFRVLKIDASGPDTNIIYPTSNSNLSFNTSINLNFSVSDGNSGLANCSYNLDNTTNITIQGCTNTTFNASEGTHTLYFYTNDTLGNENNSETVTFTIDLTNPQIDFAGGTESNNTLFNKDWIYVNVSVTETNFKNITFYLYNSISLLNATNYSTQDFDVNFTNLNPNEYYFYNVTIRDTTNHTNSTLTRKITLDDTIPTISFNPNTDTNGTWKQVDYIYINVSAYDLNNNTIGLQFNGANETFDNREGNDSWENKTGLTTGSYLFYAWMNDSAGNFNKTGTYNISIDLENPSLTLLYPLAITYNVNTSLPLNYTVSDTYLSNCWYNLNNNENISLTNCNNATFNVSAATASHDLYLYANDSSGRLSSETVMFSINIGTPSIILDLPEDNGWLNYNQNINFNYTPTDAGLADCSFWTNSTGTWHNNQTVTLGAGETGNQQTFYLNVTDGNYIWNVNCSNAGGNSDFSLNNFTVNTDSVYPTIEFIGGTPENNTNSTSTSIFVNVSASDTNFDSIIFDLYNSTARINRTIYTNNNILNITWSNLEDAVYYFNVTINDSSNNINSTETRVRRLDDTIPTLTILNPLTQNYGYNDSINLNYTTTDNVIGLDECWYYVYNSSGALIIPTVTLSSCENTSFSLLGDSDIDYTVTLFSKDLLGNSNSEVVTFGIRMVAPAIVLDNPSDEYHFNTLNNIRFNFTPTDGDGVDTCELWGNWSGNWKLNQTLTSTSGIQNNFDRINLSLDETPYKWNVWCNDTFNNSGWALNNLTFHTDATIPQANLTSPTATGYSSLSISLQHSEYDYSLNECKYDYAVGGAGASNTSVTCNSDSIIVFTAYGSYTFNYYVLDNAGNVNNTQVNFTIIQPSTSNPSGGGKSTQSILETNITEQLKEATFCGNNVCQIGESPITCPQDCPANFGELLCPILGGGECKAWVFNFLIWLIGGTIVFILFKKQRGEPIKFGKFKL